MQTQAHFNTEGMFCELGGELVDTGHEDLWALCAELGLPLQKFADYGKGLPEEVFFFGGRSYCEAEVLEAFAPLAQIIAADRAFLVKDGELQYPSYREPLGAETWDQMTLAEYLHRQRNRVEPWVLELIGSAYVGEYGADLESQSALNLLTFISTETNANFDIFGDSDEAYRIVGGSARLPARLYQSIRGRVPVHMGARLSSLRDKKSGFELHFATPEGTVRVRADRVVSALPFPVLREVEGLFDLDLSAVKKRAIRELGMGQNAKTMLGFKNRFWNLSTQRVPASQGGLMSDLGGAEFWDTSRAQDGSSGILTHYLGGSDASTNIMVAPNSALAALEQVWPGCSKAFDNNVSFKTWQSSPYALGSYSTYRPGQWTSLAGSPAEPELNGRLLFAGEQSSENFSGYMNGAVEAGNAAARLLLTPDRSFEVGLR